MFSPRNEQYHSSFSVEEASCFKFTAAEVFFVILRKVCTREVLKSQRGTLARETQTRWQSDNARSSTLFSLTLLSIRPGYFHY